MTRKVHPKLAAAFFAMLLASAAALAQAPCPCPTPTGPPPLWSGNAQFAYAGTSGNTDTSSLGASLELNYKPAPWTFTLTAAYLRGSTDGDLTAESFAGGLRGIRDLTPRFDVFAEGLYYRNTFAGIDSRYGANTGVGYKIFNEKTLLLRVEAGIGYTREDFILEESQDYASVKTGFQFKWKFSKSAEFSEELYWTDDLSDTDNWFLRSTTAVVADLTSIFALKASFTYLYDNEPAVKERRPSPLSDVFFEKTDRIFSVALVAKF
jgi:putative salt-induced outer membrane protein YdiY